MSIKKGVVSDMMIDICLASMIAMNCLAGASPSADCNVPVEKAKQVVEEVEKSHSLVLLEGVAGTNPHGHEVFRSIWVPPGQPELAMVVHYVPEIKQCNRMSIEEFLEHATKEEQYKEKNRNKPTI